MNEIPQPPDKTPTPTAEGPATAHPAAGRESTSRRRKWRVAPSILYRGEPYIWLTGGALALAIWMILGLLVLVLYQGATTFWPVPIVKIQTADGSIHAGEISRTDSFEMNDEMLSTIPADQRDAASEAAAEQGGTLVRRLVRTGNFELTGEHFHWVSDFNIARETRPEWMLVVERLSWGRFYGEPAGFILDGTTVATAPEEVWSLFREYHDESRERWEERRRLETHEIGVVNAALEEARLEAREVALEHGENSPEYEKARDELAATTERVNTEYERIRRQIDDLNAQNEKYKIHFRTALDNEQTMVLADIVRAYPANQLGFGEKLSVYTSRWWEFLTAEPREANSEGGVWPAIFGTVVMTFIMTLAVVPFGVLAALYLKEYAKAGFVVSSVRIAVNNLAGVPSIVFGVFGLGFFCYIVGGGIDQLFFEAKLPSPTYGTGGVLWASLTLALLTLPVVIVATEEALSAVPNSMREGSYACGASKWQTIRRIVLPRAMPGIMTGMILAVARGAGEVAPLMLVGAVKLAPDLPVDSIAPYIHPERSFMHLGFHIYDLGFQSQNSEAAKPMVFTTTLLLIAIVAVLNITAVWLRSRLRRKFVSGHV